MNVFIFLINIIIKEKLINKNYNNLLIKYFKVNKTLKVLKRKYY